MIRQLRQCDESEEGCDDQTFKCDESVEGCEDQTVKTL